PNTLFVGEWEIPDSLPNGDYSVLIEVNKQWDQDASMNCRAPVDCGSGAVATVDCPSFAPFCDCHSKMCERHVSTYDSLDLNYGMGGNLGQPSVVWQARITIEGADPDHVGGTHVATTDMYIGFGDWDSPHGNLFPPDDTVISNRAGSGSGRLAHVTD